MREIKAIDIEIEMPFHSNPLMAKKIKEMKEEKPWCETPFAGQLEVGGSEGCRVFICPKNNSAKELKDIDVVRLVLENARGQKNEFISTPDEALEIAAALTNGVMFWLTFKYRPYIKKFNVRRNNLTQRSKKIKKA